MCATDFRERHSMTPITHEIELESPLTLPAEGKPVLNGVLPFLGAVKVRVAVRVGHADISVAELASLAQGAVLELDRFVDEPLDILVDGHVVARGTLVAVGEYFGVR